MVPPVGLARISLASVVLDRPDQSGIYIAKDLAGGWAYLVADGDGDNRYRGQGVCEGGLDVALRCAFLSAAARVPDSRRMTVLVQDHQAHRAMVRLAMADPRVIAAIGGREVAVMTRPEERASFHVRSAAERAAAAALLDRERAEWRVEGERAATDAPAIEAAPAASSAWRSRRLATPPSRQTPEPETVPPRATPRRRILSAWLDEFDNRVASVSSDLRDVGA